MSAGHLSRQFKAAYGETVYSYLMTRRIERAMALDMNQVRAEIAGQAIRVVHAADIDATLKILLGELPLKQAVADAEKKLAELNTLNSRIEEALSRPGLYTDAPERAQKLIKQKADLARLITAAEERWLSAQQAYEEAMVEA